VPAEVLEVDLVVLDPADREGQVDLQRPNVRVHLVRAGEVDLGELAEDLVPLVDVSLVQLVVSLDRLPRDAVQLEQAGLQRAADDLLVVERKRRHRFLSSLSAGAGSIVEPRNQTCAKDVPGAGWKASASAHACLGGQ